MFKSDRIMIFYPFQPPRELFKLCLYLILLYVLLCKQYDWYSMEWCDTRKGVSWKIIFLYNLSIVPRTPDPSVKVNSTWSQTMSTLLHWLVLLSVCLIYPMSGRYSTNWDRKGWPGSEIQMYYSCPWFTYIPYWSLLWHNAVNCS